MIVGVLVWFGVDWGIRYIGPILERAGFLAQCAAAVAASAILLLAQAGVLAALRPIVDPSAWAENAARINVIAPRDPTNIVSMAGLLLGLGAGLACQRRWAPFRADGPLGKRALRFLVGLIVLLIIWRGLPILWNEYAQPQALALFLRYVRYGLVGYWAVFLAPLVFLKLKLTEPGAYDKSSI